MLAVSLWVSTLPFVLDWALLPPSSSEQAHLDHAPGAKLRGSGGGGGGHAGSGGAGGGTGGGGGGSHAGGAGGVDWTQVSPTELYARYRTNVPTLPDRRVSTLTEADWAATCGPWWATYDVQLRATRATSPCDGASVRAGAGSGAGAGGEALPPKCMGPTTGSHGIGDWHMLLLGQMSVAFANHHAIVVDWPDLAEWIVPPPPLSPSTSAAIAAPIAGHNDATCAEKLLQMPAAYGQPLEHHYAVRSARDNRPTGSSADRACKIADTMLKSGMRTESVHSCSSRLLLSPTPKLLDFVAPRLRYVRDPYALTIAIHLRTGKADPSEFEEGEFEGGEGAPGADWRDFLQHGVACARDIEADW